MPAEVVLWAAEEAAGGRWDGATIAAVLAAIGGVATGLLTGLRSLRSDKFKRNVEAGAALLTGYTDMVAQLRAELNRVKDENHEDKESWRVEREAIRREFAEDRERMRSDHKREVDELNDRIDELSSQLYALSQRGESGKRTRSTDPGADSSDPEV